MNDLHYIFYEAKRMFLDTVGLTAEGERAHRRLCDYTWFNDGPPLNQNKSLRQISQTDDTDWSAVKRELLAKGWLEIGEYLLHRGVIKSLNESKLKYVENFNRQAKMNKAVPLRLSPPDTVTGVVTIIVTLPVTPTVTRTQSESQPEPESEKNYSLGSRLSEGGVGGVVMKILGNGDGWAYDNCKVKAGDFTAGQLTTVLREFLGKIPGSRNITCAQAVKAWLQSVLKAHKDAVDGMIRKNPAASCIDEWKRQLTAAAAAAAPPARSQTPPCIADTGPSDLRVREQIYADAVLRKSAKSADIIL